MSRLKQARQSFAESLSDGSRAWYYYRGKLTEIDGEHPGPVGAIYKGNARVRYHEETETLAVQARSRRICQSAVNAYIDAHGFPGRINAEWPGHFEDCYFQDWK